MFNVMLFFLPLLGLCMNSLEMKEEDLNPESKEVLILKPQKYLRHESMIYNLNSELGIKDQRHYTGSDLYRLSFAGHVNGSYEYLQRLLGFDLNLMKRSTRYHQLWYGVQFFNHRSSFQNLSTNPTGSLNPQSDSVLQKPNQAKENLSGYGLGLGYRFKLLLDFFETEDIFENIDVYVNRLEMQDEYLNAKYRGYGLSAHYGIHKRAGTSLFYGGKLSYSIAPVTRDAIGSEKNDERSLSLGWMSYAFEMGIYF